MKPPLCSRNLYQGIQSTTPQSTHTLRAKEIVSISLSLAPSDGRGRVARMSVVLGGQKRGQVTHVVSYAKKR